MKILPPTTHPAQNPLERRHDPWPAGGEEGYRRYRACLRWEFGFTCGFCLLHESDMAEHGVEGTGLTTVEHHVPVSSDRSVVNSYQNCFYACRFCNRSRSDSSVVDRRGKGVLLDPVTAAWGQHFKIVGDELLPVDGDANAAYTAWIYDLNDPRKVRMRRSRRERLGEWLELLRDGPRLLDRLLERAAQEPKNRSLALLKAAEELRRSIRRASRDIERFAAVPRDADTKCRCGRDDHHTLPDWLEEQLLEIPVLDEGDMGLQVES
jgi:hypothetical protein